MSKLHFSAEKKAAIVCKVMDYTALASSTEATMDRTHKLAMELWDTEVTLSKTSELMGAGVQYAKTQTVKILECDYTRIACRFVQAWTCARSDNTV